MSGPTMSKIVVPWRCECGNTYTVSTDGTYVDLRDGTDEPMRAVPPPPTPTGPQPGRHDEIVGTTLCVLATCAVLGLLLATAMICAHGPWFLFDWWIKR